MGRSAAHFEIFHDANGTGSEGNLNTEPKDSACRHFRTLQTLQIWLVDSSGLDRWSEPMNSRLLFPYPWENDELQHIFENIQNYLKNHINERYNGPNANHNNSQKPNISHS